MSHATDAVTPRAIDGSEIRRWLRETDEQRLSELWARADQLRRAHVGDAVHLRGLVELSNHCVRGCLYCGISTAAGPLERYRLTADQVLACALQARDLGYGTVVLQAGEDPGLTCDFVAGIVGRIKAGTNLAVTLSLGERNDAELRVWRDAGGDRYLLRFETSDQGLYELIHPARPGTVSDRVAQLERMRAMGYEIGSGVMVGIPGQTWEILARDLELFAGLDLDMIGVGPYLPSPRTPLAGPLGGDLRAPAAEQVPNDELTTLKVVALSRVLCPESNIPSTTALATLDREQGRELGLMRGANVVMPNLTPAPHRVLYDIYPGKACVHETGEARAECLEQRIRRIGRTMGSGHGGRQRKPAAR